MASRNKTASPLRLAFMGTPDFAIPTLDALIDRGHDVVCVYTRPPQPAGRGKRLRESPVHRRAQARGIPVRHPHALRGADEQAAFAALALDVAVVAAYGLILPAPILEAPRHGCINVHASLLPRWRGAAPIQRSILAGDRITGISIMKMDEGLDTGPVIAVCETPIADRETAQSLHDRLAARGAECLIPALEAYVRGAQKPVAQPESGVTYAAKIDKAEARIDWRAPAEAVDRQVRALSPVPGAWTRAKGERLKILAGRPNKPVSAEAGTIVDAALRVACGTGSYTIERAQRAGRTPAATSDLLRGFELLPDTRLE